MDDVAEQQEIANEISEAISNPVGFGQDADEVRYIIMYYSKSSFRLGKPHVHVILWISWFPVNLELRIITCMPHFLACPQSGASGLC